MFEAKVVNARVEDVVGRRRHVVVHVPLQVGVQNLIEYYELDFLS